MNTRFCAGVAALLALGTAVASFACQGPEADRPTWPDAGLTPEHHGFAGCAIDSSTGVPLRYASGATVPNAVVHLIYWLPTPSDHFVAGDSPSDAVYEGLVQQFVADVDSVSVFGVVKEYLGQKASVALGGTLVYARPYPKAGSATAPLQDSDIQAAVADVLDHFGTSWKAGPSDIFAVFTAANIQSCNGSSCTAAAAADTAGGQAIGAWHGSFAHAGATVVYANIPSAASIGVPRGGPNDPDIDPTIQMLSHELFESMTDPTGSGWSSWNDPKNPSGGDCGEMGDHCPLGADGSEVVLSSGHEYLLPSMWSNAAGGCTLDLPAGPGCSFPAQTACGSEWVPPGFGTPSNTYLTVDTVPVTCPNGATAAALLMAQGSKDVSQPLFCPNLGYSSLTPNLYVVGQQSQGSATAGSPAIGSTQSVATCVVSSSGQLACDPFRSLTVTDCCQPLTCQDGMCGPQTDGCGNPLVCGGCSAGQACTNNICQSAPSCHTAITCCIESGGEWIRGKCQFL